MQTDTRTDPQHRELRRVRVEGLAADVAHSTRHEPTMSELQEALQWIHERQLGTLARLAAMRDAAVGEVVAFDDERDREPVALDGYMHRLSRLAKNIAEAVEEIGFRLDELERFLQ